MCNNTLLVLQIPDRKPDAALLIIAISIFSIVIKDKLMKRLNVQSFANMSLITIRTLKFQLFKFELTRCCLAFKAIALCVFKIADHFFTFCTHW